MDLIPQHWKDLWEKWDLRAFILLSLTLQAFLILFAPLRKRTSSNWIVLLLWSAYLLADWAANFAVGLISSSQSNKCKSKSDNNNADLLAFWAPFLLVHLGGPDTITAFSLEDNELWLRHLLTLFVQSFAAGYVFFLSLPKNELWIPTGLMFFAGIIKYFERARSLYLASLNRFRDSMLRDPDPGPNYAKLMDEYDSRKKANLPTEIEMVPEPPRGAKSVNQVKLGKLSPAEAVLYAKKYFDTFKGLIVDLLFSVRDRNLSRDFFLQRSAEDAFHVIMIELNLFYDVLFTKVSVVYTKLGCSLRFVATGLVVTSLGLFYSVDKYNYQPCDIAITYTLLLGAVALDVVAFIMLIISDWLKVFTLKLPEVNLKNETPKSNQESSDKETKELDFICGRIRKFVRPFHRRWSEHLATYNLIYCCLHRRCPENEKILDSFGLTSFFDSFEYVRHKPFTNELRDHIFEELKSKSELAEDVDTAKEVSAAKGDLVLRIEGCTKLLPYVLEVDYDQSLLLWHVATELCYCDEINSAEKTMPENGGDKSTKNYRAFSKLLSDYMLYLMIMQPTMMSAVAGIGQVRFRDTCAEAQKFILGESEYHQRCKKALTFQVIIYGFVSFIKYTFLFIIALLSPVLAFIVSLFVTVFHPLMQITCPKFVAYVVDKRKKALKWAGKNKHLASTVHLLQGEPELDQRHIDECKHILGVNTEVKPVTIKGDKSKSVLFDGCILAKELKELEKAEVDAKDKWKIMSKVWVEMLSYAAIRCRAQAHAQQLTRGGELMTLVWLLMAHFGLGDQFQINEGQSRAKLVVGK